MLNERGESPCPHGQRGTIVCLYCRQEARADARRKRNQLLARAGLTTAGGAVVLALIIGGLVTLAPDAQSDSLSVAQREVGSADTADSSTALVPARAAAVAPTIPFGRKELGDGVVADRRGDTVVVSFDTEALRTRFDWKFEGVVRGTLPLVFGDRARAALDSVPSGELVRGGTLLAGLTERGIRVRLPGESGVLVIRPVSRPGEDGPLVIGYRAVVSQAK